MKENGFILLADGYPESRGLVSERSQNAADSHFFDLVRDEAGAPIPVAIAPDRSDFPGCHRSRAHQLIDQGVAVVQLDDPELQAAAHHQAKVNREHAEEARRLRIDNHNRWQGQSQAEQAKRERERERRHRA